MSAEPAPHRWVGQTCSVRREPQIWRHVFSCGENLRSDDMFFGVTRTLDLMTCSAFNVGGQSDCFDMAFWQLSHLGFQGAVRNVPFYTWKVIWIVKKVRKKLRGQWGKVPLDTVVLEGFQDGALLQPSFDLGDLRAGEPQCPRSAFEQWWFGTTATTAWFKSWVFGSVRKRSKVMNR